MVPVKDKHAADPVSEYSPDFTNYTHLHPIVHTRLGKKQDVSARFCLASKVLIVNLV